LRVLLGRHDGARVVADVEEWHFRVGEPYMSGTPP